MQHSRDKTPEALFISQIVFPYILSSVQLAAPWSLNGFVFMASEQCPPFWIYIICFIHKSALNLSASLDNNVDSREMFVPKASTQPKVMICLFCL